MIYCIQCCHGFDVGVKVAALKPGIDGRAGSVGIESHHPLEDALAGIVDVEIMGSIIFPFSADVLLMNVIAPNASRLKIPKIRVVIFCC